MAQDDQTSGFNQVTFMPPRPASPDPEALAIEALTFLAQDSERLERFLTLTGIDPSTLRQVAGESNFFSSVLDHLLNDEALLLAFAAERRIQPEQVGLARHRLERTP